MTTEIKNYILRWSRVNETAIQAWDDKDAHLRAQSLMAANPGAKLISVIEETTVPEPTHEKFMRAIMDRITNRWNPKK